MSDDQPRPMDDLMGGWDIGWRGEVPETTSQGSRWEFRSYSEATIHSAPPTFYPEVYQQLVRTIPPPAPKPKVEFVRDLLTGEEYFFLQEIDNGYVLGKTSAGEEVCIGLLAWERFTR